MNKKQIKILITAFVILAVCIIVLLAVKKSGKKESGNEIQEKTADSFIPENAGNITELVLKMKDNELGFYYNDSKGIWEYAGDTAFPLDNNKIMNVINKLKDMKKLREIKDYSSLDDFKLSEPALTLSLKTDGDYSSVLYFSDYLGNDNVYYVRPHGSDIVYLTDADLCKYASYELINYVKFPEMPDFSPSTVKSITVDIDGGSRIELVPGEVKAGETDAGEWYYYVASNGETVNDRKKCSQNDINVFFNYLTDLCYNRVIEYAPEDTRLDFYGLKQPKGTVTVNFKGLTTVINTTDAGQRVEQLTEADFNFRLFIGNEIKESDGEYYVTDTCTDSVGSENLYDGGNCVFAANSYYAKFFIELTENKLNGKDSGK